MESKEHKVSIIVPAHNAANTINRCIDSILNQTYNNFEIIVVDNDSSDNLDRVINAYDDSRIIYVRTDKKGVSNARNIGIRKSSGEFVSFCDADDEYTSDFIENMVKNSLANNVKIVKCAVSKVFDKRKTERESLHELADRVVDPKNLEENNILRDLFFRSNKEQIQCTTPSLLIRKSILVKNKIFFDIDICMMEDVLFYAYLFSLGEKISFIDKSLYLYFQNPNSATHSKHNYKAIIDGAILSCSKLHKKLGEDPRIDMKYLRIIFHYMSCEYFANGNIYAPDELNIIARNAKLSKNRYLWTKIAKLIENERYALLKVLFRLKEKKNGFKNTKNVGRAV